MRRCITRHMIFYFNFEMMQTSPMPGDRTCSATASMLSISAILLGLPFMFASIRSCRKWSKEEKACQTDVTRTHDIRTSTLWLVIVTTTSSLNLPILSFSHRLWIVHRALSHILHHYRSIFFHFHLQSRKQSIVMFVITRAVRSERATRGSFVITRRVKTERGAEVILRSR